MSVERKNTEIFSQEHQMYAEGSSDEYPLGMDIEALLESEGWSICDVDVWFDNSQKIYRWYCRIY